YSVQAADQAAAALAFDNAAEYYRFALELQRDNNGQRQTLQFRLAEALCNAGRGAEGAQAYVAAAADACEEDKVDLRRRAAAHFLMAGRIEEGLALTDVVLKAVGMTMPASQWRALLSFFGMRVLIRLRGLGYHHREASDIPVTDLLRIDICGSLAQGLGM